MNGITFGEPARRFLAGSPPQAVRFFTSLSYPVEGTGQAVLNDRYLNFIKEEDWGWEKAPLSPTPNPPEPL